VLIFKPQFEPKLSKKLKICQSIGSCSLNVISKAKFDQPKVE
jgi:hypothetical protein